MARHPVFLLLFGIVFVTAHVDPPLNVSLDCKNLRNILTWAYNENRKDLQFKVDIGAYYSAEGVPKVTWVNATDREADVSFLSDPAEQYSVTVTAVLGENESDASPLDGLSFSYYKDAPVDYLCYLDLPSVNVTEQPHNKIQWSFEHPWLLYQKLGGVRSPKAKRKRMHATQTVLPPFKYSVALVNQTPHGFDCDEAVCVEEIPVDPALEKHCVHIEGNLKEMMVKGNGMYCSQTLIPPDYTYIYMVVALLIITAVAGVIIMIFYKKTRPSTQTQSPKSTNIPSRFEERIVNPEDEPFASLASSPTPLLTSEDRLAVEDVVAPSDHDDLRMPIRPLVNDPDGSANVQVDQVSEEDPEYRQGNVLDEDGYMERPAVLEEGYRGAEDLEDSSASDCTS